jgi:hypothetical protein
MSAETEGLSECHSIGYQMCDGDAALRLRCCLDRLMPHVEAASIALTGGVAIELHRRAANACAPERPLADVDFVAARASVVSSSVTRDFRVGHFHSPQPGYAKFLIQLVDPVSRLRIDIFPDKVGSICRARQASVAGVLLRVLDADDILNHKLDMLTQATATDRCETKHYCDAQLLGVICGRGVPCVPAAHLCDSEYSQDPTLVCKRCSVSRDAAFPLAPKHEILQILGHV